MTPQTIRPRCLARRHGYHIVSSTWRNNASIFDPTGDIIAQVAGSGGVAVERIDLSWVRLNWQAALRNGLAFDERYGPRAAYRYSEAEDGGIFWSNDPRTPIGKMVRDLGLRLPEEEQRRAQRLQDAARGGPVSLM